MMRYFELRDDMLIAKRWHLGEVVASSGDEPRLRVGISFDAGEQPLKVEVGQVGKALEYSSTSFAVPIARLSLGEAIEQVAAGDVQRIPVNMPGYHDFEVLNSVRVVRCLDENRSEFTKWTKNDHRAHLAGQYRMVTRLKIMSEHVPADAHFFRVEGWLVALIVSEKVKEAMERVGCLGAKFVAVT